MAPSPMTAMRAPSTAVSFAGAHHGGQWLGDHNFGIAQLRFNGNQLRCIIGEVLAEPRAPVA